jgi:hypothetical protein
MAEAKIFGETISVESGGQQTMEVCGIIVGIGHVNEEPGYDDYYYPVVGNWEGDGKGYKTIKGAAKAVERKLLELKNGIFKMQQVPLT